MIGVRPLTRRAAQTSERTGFPFLRLSLVASMILLLLAWTAVLQEEARLAAERPTPPSLDHLIAFGRDLLGIGSPQTPAFLRPDRWAAMGNLALETLAMSVLAAAVAGALVLPTVVFAARNIASGALRPSSSPVWPALSLVIRGFYLFSRSIPELLWALLIIFVLSPGMLPGALALACHNVGILGKLGAEVIEDLDIRPIRALQGSGARPSQVLAYGILPAVLPRFLTYLLYRWEVIMRTIIVVGLVGAGGLGREFRLSLSWFHYTEVMLILIVYLVLVVAGDLISAGLRRLAR
ncbi:MAG TPA: ABC transporter permease subunit [Dehalococcoidia bacterium]|nr:ABC transporter permease subunit [Dehalococcoidia bacterium]